MNRRVVTVVLMISFLLALAAYLGRGYFLFMHIPHHMGDGEFQNVSRREGPIVMNGYHITFDRMDLSRDYEKSWKLTRLPSIGRPKCQLYLIIDDLEGQFERKSTGILLHGHVALCLIDSHGSRVANVTGELRNLVWTGSVTRHALYSQQFQNVFEPDVDESYTLTISYKGDEGLAGLIGFVSIECGGRK